MENNSTLEKALLVCNRNAELLRLVEATFYSKVASLRRLMIRREKFDHSEKFAEKKALAYGHFLFYLFCHCLHLSCQISIESVRNTIYMLTEHTYDSVLYLKFFSILYSNLSFIEQ